MNKIKNNLTLIKKMLSSRYKVWLKNISFYTICMYLELLLMNFSSNLFIIINAISVALDIISTIDDRNLSIKAFLLKKWEKQDAEFHFVLCIFLPFWGFGLMKKNLFKAIDIKEKIKNL